ncbi:VIT1/CCC1 transporter family protein [Pseudomaricurvus sp.]|uniref:VIT1/CCC1 transporter family protein n=1 Tax=Pseudomaricurvus sp. TaxID=2004510 RepID=UPI003F6B1A3A
MTHQEHHRSHRSGWLRAAVLGANDGIVSTASLIIGVASANTSQENILLAGVASLVAGAMSMAAGEYVSVSSQADTEQADLKMEKRSLDTDFHSELEELADIYVERGLEPELATEVAKQLMAQDALAAHARDEIGISEVVSAQPIQAAASSATTFVVGAALPLAVAWVVPGQLQVLLVAIASLIFLGFLGGLAAKAGGAPVVKGVARVTFWGAFAMLVTAGVGRLFGVAN